MSLLVLFYVLSLWQTQVLPQRLLNIYSTNNREDDYCLFYYVRNEYQVEYADIKAIKTTHQIIPYCLWLSKDIFTADRDLNNTTDQKLSFAELRKANITSQQLMSWLASIDQAERYQIYLDGFRHSLSSPSLSVENEISFYNCTSPWFGPLCRFAFDLLIGYSLDDMVDSIMQPIRKYRNLTCYQHLDCITPFSCLDWRDVCDGKSDCFDGSDEFTCWQLEMNECARNEYRCHNGQCIPNEFFHDNPSSPDCIDQSDEPIPSISFPCPHDPSFLCEEYICRPEHGFACGDGSCEVRSSGGASCPFRFDKIPDDNLCSITMICSITTSYLEASRCEKACPNRICPGNNCPSMYEFPPFPVLYGHVHFVFMNKERQLTFPGGLLPDYVCYNKTLCSDFLPPTMYFNNFTCRQFSELGLKNAIIYPRLDLLLKDLKNIFRLCTQAFNQMLYCNHSTMYRCLNSTKCISKHRLVDGLQDCPFNDDETFNESCSLDDVQYRVTCLMNGNTKCLSPLTFLNEKKDCQNGEDEYTEKTTSIQKHIYFQTLCDGVQELLPKLIDEQNVTDETECHYWPCNNTYTRCNGYWTCRNGIDELNCPLSTCPEYQHKCIMPNDTFKISCLPMTQVNDGIVDCLGGTDERHYCRVRYPSPSDMGRRFRCWNDTNCIPVGAICAAGIECRFGDDEAFCKERAPCVFRTTSWTEIEHLMCTLNDETKGRIIYLKLTNMPIYSSIITNSITLIPAMETKILSIQTHSTINRKYNQSSRCHRGLPIHIRMSNDTSEVSCFCPPSYYGDSCEYQNQRVSLILQIRSMSNWRRMFTFLITLIDDEGNIESHDYIHYQSIRDCNTKFHINLLYSTQPKTMSKKYAIQIDKFDPLILKYQGSWIYPIQFPFLPVYLLSTLLQIPVFDVQPLKTSTLSCLHGQSFNYINDQNLTFCHCEPGWTGVNCTIKHRCTCAPDSICITDSICVCSFDRYGRRCYLSDSSCHSQVCLNGGQCIPNDERYKSTHVREFICICREEYYGDQCEYQQTRIDISFDKQLTIPSSLLVHFITTQSNAAHMRRSTRKKLAFDQKSLTLYVSFTFHLAFAQIMTDYYLIILRGQDIISSNVTSKLLLSHRCLPVNQVFNETIANQHLLRRMKYYHIPCTEQFDLVCFYDTTQLCLCNLARQTNCLEFNHTINYRCRAERLCENNGHCFEDDPKCPTRSICVCLECYYGSRCQFSTKESTLSLDLILIYHIHSNKNINQQPIIIKIAMAVTIIMLCLGLINGILSILTFRTDNTCQVGCGLYLFSSSIISVIITSILTIKFWIFLSSQIGSMSNRWFMSAQCIVIDFFLRFLLSTSDWFSACVAIERVLNASTGINFNKIKSKRMAKWMILIIFLFTISTHIHDPFHRHLIDDEEEERTWCVTKYPSFLEVYNTIVNVIHFVVPFSINGISALLIILTTARTRSNAQKRLTYKQLLREQLHIHKHLLISSLILVVLALPRLIISFLSGCMKSARDSWLYLLGYFISFCPPMLTFVVFILPSDTYKKEFLFVINRFRLH